MRSTDRRAPRPQLPTPEQAARAIERLRRAELKRAAKAQRQAKGMTRG